MRTGKFYSFVVIAQEEVPLPEHLLILEPGMNVFNAQIEDLDLFLVMLKEARVDVKEANQIGGEDGESSLTQAPFFLNT